MIIVCPACSDPYQIEDDKIAPLVQVACPHCQEKIILDFEAANDASLVEPAMKMAQGFRSEADYRGAASGVAAAPAVTPTPKPSAGVAAPKPAPPQPATPARAPAQTSPAQPKPAAVSPAPPPAEPAAAPIELTEQVEPTPAADEAPAVVDLGAPISADAEEPDPVEIDTNVEIDDRDDDSAGPRAPAHTPPAAAVATSAPPASEPIVALDAESPAELSSSNPWAEPAAKLPADTPEEGPKKKRGAGRAILMLLIGLLLIGGALAGWAYVETGDPNPIPFIQSLLG